MKPRSAGQENIFATDLEALDRLRQRLPLSREAAVRPTLSMRAA